MCDARPVSGFLRVFSGGGTFVPGAHCAANILVKTRSSRERHPCESKGAGYLKREGRILATLEYLPPLCVIGRCMKFVEQKLPASFKPRQLVRASDARTSLTASLPRFPNIRDVVRLHPFEIQLLSFYGTVDTTTAATITDHARHGLPHHHPRPYTGSCPRHYQRPAHAAVR
jgi:hypothetical protein